MQRLLFLFFFLLTVPIFSQDVDRFCNENACGDLEPNWELSGQTVVCEGEDFNLSAGSSKPFGNIANYYWFIEDLATNNVLFDTAFTDTTLLTYNYSLSDSAACLLSNDKVTLQVRLVINSEACNGEERSCRFVTKPLTVFLKPRANFNADNTICVGETLRINNNSCHGNNFEWDFGDGTSSQEESPTKVYDTPGRYTIRLRASNDCGDDFFTSQINVVGEPEAAFDAELGDGSFCLPKTLDLIDRSNSFSLTRWEIRPNQGWEFTDTSMTLDTDDISIRFLQSGDYTIRMVASNDCPEDDEIEETITIFSPPNIQLLDSLSFCDQAIISSGDLNFSVNGDYENVDWQFENASLSSASGEVFSGVRFNQSGRVIVAVEGPCETLTDTADIFVASTEAITLSPDNPTALCQNTPPIQLLAEPLGGRWEGPGSIQANGTIDPGNLNPGQYTFTYNAGSEACPNNASLEIIILPAVSASLAAINPACGQLSLIPEVNYTGTIDNYSWTFPGGNPGSSSVAKPTNIQFSSPGTFNIEVIASGECGTDTATTELFIQNNEPIQINDLNEPLCSGSDPIQLEASPPNGSWSGSGVDNNGVFDPGAVNPDNSYAIRYEISNGACNNSAEIIIEVVSSVEVAVMDEIFCEDSPPTRLAAMPGGGFWSGQGIIDSISGLFDPGLADIGSFSLSYTYTDVNNCTVVGNATVEVEAFPALQKTDTIQLCLADFDAELPVLVNYQATPGDGETIWSGPGITNANRGIFNAGTTNLLPGKHTIRLQYTRNQCTVTDSVVIDLIEAEELLLSPDTTVCIADGFLQLNTNLNGGTWQGPGIDNAGLIDLTTAGGGDYTYTYSFGQGTSCAQEDRVEVEILDLGSQINTGGDQSACEGSATAQLIGASPNGGYWQGPGIIDAANGIIDLSQIQTETVYTYQYCLESSLVENCQACRPKSFILHSQPVADFTLNGNACINQSFNLINLSSGADQYEWDFGDGKQSSDSAPDHIYQAAGTYALTLISSSAFGCKDTSIQELYVTTPPKVSFSLDENEGCAPFQVITQNQSTGDSLSYLWTIGENTYPGLELDSVWVDSITEDTRLAVVLEVSNFCGNVNQVDSILVRPYPQVNFGISEDEGCSPHSLDIINTSLGNPDNYWWDFGNGITSTAFEPNPPAFTTTDDLVSRYPIRLSATNECGSDSLVKQVTVYPPDVEAFIELDTLEGCSPLAFQLKSVSTPGSTLSWTFTDPLGQESGSAMENPIVTLEEPGLHTFVLAASNCGTDTDTAQVNILPAPTIKMEHRPFVCLGQAIQFFNQSEDINGSIWDFGDGNTSLERSPTHIFDSVGTYTLTLTAFSNTNNCPSTITSTIEVLGLPTAAFESDVTQGCGPLKVKFSNTSPGANDLNFIWDFGDGSSRVFTQNSSHTFSSPGNYQVMLTAYNADSCYADTSLLNIFVFEDPISSFEVAQDRFCAGVDSLILRNTSTKAVSYQWTIKNELFDSQDLIYPLVEAEELQVSLIVQNNFQCADTSFTTITVNPSPIADFGLSTNEGCESLQVDFRQNSAYANQYFWDFGNGNTSTDESPTHIFRESGTYTVTLTAINDNECPADSLQSEVNVLSKPLASFSFEKPEECGTPTEVIFTNHSIDNQDNYWDFGDGLSSDETNPTYFYVDFGAKQVQLIVTNTDGCKDTTEQVVDIFGQPLAEFELSTENGCERDTIQVINNSSEALAFEWQIEEQEERTEIAPSLVYQEAGRYKIHLIASYNAFCQDTISKTLVIFAAPIADFSYQSDFDPSVLGETQFNNLTIQGDRFLWDFGDGTISNQIAPYHEYLVNRSLEVTLTAYQDNGGLFTCIDSISKPVDPEWLSTFYAPNALAPDLENEGIRHFKPVGTGLKEYQIEVYSPWGTVVWQSTELERGQPIGQWDGTYNGKALPQGAYTWVATMTFEDGNKQRKIGTVTILR